MSFDVRDPKTTARLESALIFLTKNNDVSVAYLTRRYELDEGMLQAWLDAFNGGKKEITISTIGRVKAELGAVTVTKVAPVNSHAMDTAGMARAMAAVGAHAGGAPYVERAPDARPWTKVKRVRREVVTKYLPIFRAAAADQSVAAACVAAGVTVGAFWQFKSQYLGVVKISPRIVEEFEQWFAALDEHPAAVPSSASPALGRKRGPYKKRGVVAAPVATIARASVQTEGFVNPLARTLGDSTANLAAHLTDQLNTSLRAYRFEVEVRLVPATTGAAA